MNHIFTRLFITIFFFLKLLTVFSQHEEIDHTFKIKGSKRIPIYSSTVQERWVQYDVKSKDHLYIIDYKKNGSMVAKTQFLFTGKGFYLIDLKNHLRKKELLKDGIDVKYDDNEIATIEKIYKYDTLTQQTFFFKDGKRQVMVSGDEKSMNGVFKMWYPNGNISFSGNYINDKKSGLFESFDENGDLIRKGAYEDGNLISGDPVVQDFEYTDPPVQAHFIGGEDSLNMILTEKTADLPIVKDMADHESRLLSLKLSIDKTGHVYNVDVSEVNNVFDKVMVKSVFKDFKGFAPALLEDAPVRSILKQDFILTNKGLQIPFFKRSYEKKDSVEEDVFFLVEQMPEFPGGLLELRKFIAYNIRYPVFAQEHGIQGKVFVNFIVDKDGSINNIKIFRGVHPVIDEEAIRVIKLLPKWKPGMQAGKPERVSFTVPVNFVLK